MMGAAQRSLSLYQLANAYQIVLTRLSSPIEKELLIFATGFSGRLARAVVGLRPSFSSRPIPPAFAKTQAP
jgi:hypothetical protein